MDSLCRCVILNIPGALILSWGSCFAGLVVFAYYLSRGCDIFEAGYTNGNKNQIIPYYVMDKLSYPCVPGIFVAALFSGALRYNILSSPFIKYEYHSQAAILSFFVCQLDFLYFERVLSDHVERYSFTHRIQECEGIYRDLDHQSFG